MPVTTSIAALRRRDGPDCRENAENRRLAGTGPARLPQEGPGCPGRGCVGCFRNHHCPSRGGDRAGRDQIDGVVGLARRHGKEREEENCQADHPDIMPDSGWGCERENPWEGGVPQARAPTTGFLLALTTDRGSADRLIGDEIASGGAKGWMLGWECREAGDSGGSTAAFSTKNTSGFRSTREV